MLQGTLQFSCDFRSKPKRRGKSLAFIIQLSQLIRASKLCVTTIFNHICCALQKRLIRFTTQVLNFDIEDDMMHARENAMRSLHRSYQCLRNVCSPEVRRLTILRVMEIPIVEILIERSFLCEKRWGFLIRLFHFPRIKSYFSIKRYEISYTWN